MTEQYDTIGSTYEQYKNKATLPIVENFMFFNILGNFQEKTILDLACGTGFYTRLLRKGGSAKIVGVDISEEMIGLARQQEQNHPLGIEYQAFDIVKLPKLGNFDLVTAIYLLNYAENREHLLKMFQKIRNNLVENGRLVAVTIHPDFCLNKSNYTKYGMTVLKQEKFSEGYYSEAEFHTEPPFLLKYFGLSQLIYEWAATEAGFKKVTWHSIEIPPKAIEDYPKDYWRDFLENPLIIGLSCEN
ncbi:MAG: class I SAM-dependent methyltransferase [Nostoc sp. ZfuVER08]|jgi:2-polyprenyl-3-methyl-5-hydroxy-6-metoxy-1,4-benzoquinol methylase|uniref:Methyltransferase domain-containing protein n=1 Tax=Nostoc punctiforme FACHB-252 TaxID=1357509 RepID=A0ABR8HID7_NOSPU|nr:class I SAM-dependent methyltransferase [Nostoc punctiforme]MBD2615142.1 methyltransferase domain-containing protein [Nostoc punctiforme FACHB-252]MBL1203545.1 methyltransferase domain-containing protein [Nostoc sp. GBBB01]MDZ8014107.1 methyltransferase domain-containing protein [Nostoc sp. ZfuVER08]